MRGNCWETLPSAKPNSGQASSHGQALSHEPADQLVTERATRALARSKGVTRIAVEDLGPALFNRQGGPTSGRHCTNLAKRIIPIDGVRHLSVHRGILP